VTETPETPTERSVTIVFGDIAASSSMTAHFGDLAVATALRSFFVRLQELQGAYRGEFVKSLGDGFLMVFADTVDAVAFAVAIQESLIRQPIRVSESDATVSQPHELRLRIGIHEGKVFLTDTVYGREILGTPVNLAARLTANAKAGGIVLSQIVAAGLTNEQRTKLRPKDAFVDIKNLGTLQVSVIDVLDEAAS